MIRVDAEFRQAGLAIQTPSADQRMMFGRRFKPADPQASLRVARTPDDTLIWAVGDVHGCADLLETLLTAVLHDIESRGASKSHLVFLGDYIDRGTDSRGVLDCLAKIVPAPDLEVHFLRGNHEERMEAFLTQPDLGPGWCEYGGRAALGSFGVAPPNSTDGPEAWEKACRQLNAALLDGHRAVLAAQKYSVSIGDYFFAHAGAEPGIPLAAQDASQLMWIRRRFLDDRHAFEKLVVHGHTPSDQVHADHRRIGIDTGAYATGVLTGLRLDGDDRQILQTSRQGPVIELVRSALQRRR